MLQKWPLLLVFGFLAFGCTPTSFPEVAATDVMFANHQGTEFSGTLYRPAMDDKLPCLVFAHSDQSGESELDKFTCKISQQGYIVLVLDLHDDDNPVDADIFQTISAAESYLRSQTFVDSTRMAVMGAGEAGTAAIQAVAKDTSLVGVILLCATAEWRDVDATALVGKIAPRPLVIIASDRDPYVSKSTSQRLYDLAKEPKKLVWLTTEAHGIKVLSTDLEPVVRQVTLLFLKKYLK